MNFDPNETKWTAYLLNELGAEERETLEQELENNPEAQQWLDEMREASTLLSSTFAQETEITLNAEVKEAILERSAEKPSLKFVIFPTLAAAAAVMISLGWPMLRNSLGGATSELGGGPASSMTENSVHVLQDLSSRPSGGEGTIGRLKEVDQPAQVSPGTKQVAPDEGLTGGLRFFYSNDGRTDLSSVEPPSPHMVSRRVQEVSPEETEVTDFSQLMSKVSSPVVMEGLMVERKSSVSKMMDGVEKRWQAPLHVPLGSEISAPPPAISPSLDHFDPIQLNPFRAVADHPLSTFSIDVDTASYSVVRTFLNEGRFPPADAVRVEELINYFPYDYAAPQDGEAFAAHMEASVCPWAPEHTLVRIALKGKEISAEERPALNLVYLLDVSGSMNQNNKLPLVKRSLEALVTQLDERDRVAIVVYAGAAGLVLPSTPGHDSKAILDALRRLNAGGGTAGGAGIQLAYKIARDQFVKGGVNRVILCTDGDFNIGMTQTGDMQRLIGEEAKSGVFLTALGFGMGNYKDSMLETLSNKGNGNYAYIDDFTEARKVLVDQMLGTMVTIAKDVKIQVEFNPAKVAGYRLIGYENRMLKKEDFNNDKVDAGEIGAGHTVTAFYEVVQVGQPVPGAVPPVDALKYQTNPTVDMKATPEMLTLKVRHKQPDGEVSVKREYPFTSLGGLDDRLPSADFRFAGTVAAFGLWLRDPAFAETFSIDEILEMTDRGVGEDPFGYRRGFLDLIRNAKAVPRE